MPPGHVFALDLSGLQAADVIVWTARMQGVVAGVAALRQLSVALDEGKAFGDYKPTAFNQFLHLPLI